MEIDLSKFGPTSAHGCGLCDFGLLNPPPARAPVSLYVIRAIQYDKGFLTVCGCEAGQRYESYLQKRLADIRAGRDKVWGHYWGMVIDDAERDCAIVPTIHWDGDDTVDDRRRVLAREHA